MLVPNILEMVNPYRRYEDRNRQRVNYEAQN